LCNDDLLWRHFCMKACNAKQTKKAMKKMKEDSEGTSWKTVYSNYGINEPFFEFLLTRYLHQRAHFKALHS